MAKKRSDGRYVETFRYNGKRYSVYAKSLSEVRAKLKKNYACWNQVSKIWLILH